MSVDQAPTGFALRCDLGGTILEVIRNDLGVRGLIPGQPLRTAVDPSSRIKLLNFLMVLIEKGAAFDWEINVPRDGKQATFSLAGVVDKESLMVIGGHTPEGTLVLCEEIVKINNEHVNALRAVIKEQVEPSRSQQQNLNLFDEISHLNNELMNVQRELAKKNAELERLYAEVQRLSVIDPLTDVYNRRGFFDLADREVTRAKRYGNPVSVILFDLDHFKKVNDTYGHPVGDIVLAETAARCRKHLRNVDILGRYGGEEFSVLLPETNLDQARIVADRLRVIASQPIDTGETSLLITISLGLTALDDEKADLQILLQRADGALYQAKDSGRNQVAVFEG